LKGIGKIVITSIKNEFDDETKFSKYLSGNLDILGEKLKIHDLTEIEGETEVPTGPSQYRCDIVGHFEDGTIAVENQFGDSDHDHLGKLLVYLANQEAKIAVWICEKARPEHVKSIQWLNERSEDESFYLLEAKVVRIGDSLPAVDFDVIVGPEGFRDIGKERRRVKGIESEWTPALEEIRRKFLELKPQMHVNRPKATFMTIPTDFVQIHFEWHIYGRKVQNLEIALHFERDDKENNKKWVQRLLPFKEELEKLLGEQIHFGSWSKREGAEHRWTKISVKREFQKEISDELKNWAVESMAKMCDFLTPKLESVAF
jgi:hypothetical protein